MRGSASLCVRSWRSSGGLTAAFALALLSGGTLPGCGADSAVDRAGGAVGAASSALASSSSYLVSFVGGVIPANAGGLVGAAGGSIRARYASLGVVLARSDQPSFAAALRAMDGVDAVGAVSATHSRLAPAAAARQAGHPHGPRGAGADPLAVRQWDMDQIHAQAAHAI